MTDQIKEPILDKEGGGDNDTNEVDDPDITKEVQGDRTWMKIKDQDIKIVDQLIYRDHPLKNASLDYLFSETFFFCSSKKKAKHKSKQKFLRDYELEKFNEDKDVSAKGEQDKSDKAEFGDSKTSKALPDSFHTRYHQQTKDDDDITDDFIEGLIGGDKLIEGIDDPYYRFGLGIFSYLSTLRVLMRFMLFMAVISIVQMILFIPDSASMENQRLTLFQYVTSYTSLGSYFQAHSKCHKVKLVTNNLYMECPGDLVIQQIFEIGIVDHKSDICTFNADNFKQLKGKDLSDADYDDFVKDVKESTKCNKPTFYNTDQIKNYIETSCIKDQQGNNQEKTSCTIKGTKDYMVAGDKLDADCNQKLHDLDLMIQFKCGLKHETIEKRNTTGIICSSLGVLGNLVFIVMISYKLSRYNKIRKLKYAEYTVSSKNFACEITFDDDHFSYLYVNEEDKPNITQSYTVNDDEVQKLKEEGIEEEEETETNYNDWHVLTEEQIEKEAEKAGDNYTNITNDHWTQCLDRPGHWLQDRVVHQLQTVLTKFYELDVLEQNGQEQWEQTDGYKYLKQAIFKFPEIEQEKIISLIINNHTSSNDNHQFKVVFCTFAFKNMKLQQELENRGAKIKDLSICKPEEIKKKLEKLKEMNDEILKEILTDDPKDMRRVDLLTPKAAFITFQNPFAAFLAKKMMKIIKRNKLKEKAEEEEEQNQASKQREEIPKLEDMPNKKIQQKPLIFDQELTITQLGYPTDTQYENYGMNSLEYIVNFIQAAIIIFIWLYMYFQGIVTLKRMLENKKDFYLTEEQCTAITQEHSEFPYVLRRSARESFLQIKSEHPEGINFDLIAFQRKLLNKQTGELSCYCDYYKGLQDISDITILDNLVQNPLDQACKEYHNFKFWLKYISIVLTAFISVASAITQILMKYIIYLLSLKKKTDQTVLNSMAQFVTTSFISLVVPLLMNAKLDFIPYFGPKYLNQGTMRDFTWDWYMTLGTVFVLRQIVLIVGPLTLAVPAPIIKAAKQYWFKNGFFRLCMVPKRKSMWDYFKSERGNDFQFEVHAINRLAYVLFIAFMFGPAIPILFVFALLGVVIQESVLRYQLAYQYTKPLNYSNTLNTMLLKFCAFLPLMYSMFGLWQYSNRQIFDNAVVPKHAKNGLVDHNHKVTYTFTTLTPGTPFIFLLIVSTFNFVIVAFEFKYSKIFEMFTKCRNQQSDMSELRKHDPDQFYQYIRGDFQFQFYKNYQTYMDKVLKTKSISPKMYKQFETDLKKDNAGQLQLFASRMLYEMIIDHNYAMKYDFQFNLIYNTLASIKNVADIDQHVKNLLKHNVQKGFKGSMTIKDKDTAAPSFTEDQDEDNGGCCAKPPPMTEEDKKELSEERDRVVYGEHTKTLYLVNLAYMKRDLRHNVGKWFSKQCYVLGGRMYVNDKENTRSISDDRGRKFNYLFNYEQFIN